VRDGIRRLGALLRKEWLQILRDRSSFAIAFLLPTLLLVLIGWGVSLDPRRLEVAVVIPVRSAATDELVAALAGSSAFRVEVVRDRRTAEARLTRGALRAVVALDDEFAGRLAAGTARVQILLDGVDANTARLTEGYLRAVLALWGMRLGLPPPAVTVESRLWFNTAADSRHFLVPGLTAVVLTLTGALLTAMVVARGWERGTMEALFATPARRLEIFLGAFLPYLLMGLAASAVVAAAAVLVFGVPLRGSLAAFALASLLFMAVSAGFGLAVSGATRNQFVAAQVALYASLLPSFMLSGFLFDIRSMPGWLRLLTVLVPARWYVEVQQTLFLAGDVASVLTRDLAVLALFAAGVGALAWRGLRKRLD